VESDDINSYLYTSPEPNNIYHNCFPFISNEEYRSYDLILVYIRKQRTNDFVLQTILCDFPYYSKYLESLDDNKLFSISPKIISSGTIP